MNPMRYLFPVLATAFLVACAGTPEPATEPDAAVSGETPASGPLDGGRWKLAQASAGPLAALERARQVTMEFDEGRVFGYGGCNRYTSTYKVTGERLDIGQVASTLMYCEGEGNQVEQALHELLKQPFVISRETGAMRLTAPDGTQLRFEPAGKGE